jgi:DNA-binding MarR family transcriptional regulator
VTTEVHPDACSEIRRGVTRMARRLRSERPSGSLSTNAVSVLSHLHRHGPSTPGEIAAAEHQKAQSLTRVFAEMQLAGLIARRRSERDGRESVLSLTRAGRRALAADMKARDGWLQTALGTLGETELEVLLIASRILDRLSESAPELSAVASAGSGDLGDTGNTGASADRAKTRRIAS